MFIHEIVSWCLWSLNELYQRIIIYIPTRDKRHNFLTLKWWSGFWKLIFILKHWNFLKIDVWNKKFLDVVKVEWNWDFLRSINKIKIWILMKCRKNFTHTIWLKAFMLPTVLISSVQYWFLYWFFSKLMSYSFYLIQTKNILSSVTLTKTFCWLMCLLRKVKCHEKITR